MGTIKRIEWIDVMRGLAFLMVIYDHTYFASNEYILRFIHPIYLNIFFFVSGFLFKDNNLKFIFEQRTRTLLLPFLLWSSLLICQSHLISLGQHSSLYGDVISTLLIRKIDNGCCHLWFILALYVSSLIFYFIQKYFQSNKKLFVASVILLFVNILYTRYLNLSLIWGLENVGYNIFYMALGILFKRKQKYLLNYFSNWKFPMITTGLYILCLYFLNSNIDTASVITSMPGLAMILSLSIIINKNIFLVSFIGANSLLYFALHSRLQSIFEKILSMYVLDYHYLLIIGILIPFLNALILYYPILWINKYLPFTIGKGFKLYNAK